MTWKWNNRKELAARVGALRDGGMTWREVQAASGGLPESTCRDLYRLHERTRRRAPRPCGDAIRTQAEVARILGVSREAVIRAEATAFDRIAAAVVALPLTDEDSHVLHMLQQELTDATAHTHPQRRARTARSLGRSRPDSGVRVRIE